MKGQQAILIVVSISREMLGSMISFYVGVAPLG